MKKFLIILGIIILVLALIVFVFLMLTPGQIGLGNTKIGDVTLSDLGLADMKIIDIMKSVTKATKVTESDVVNNSFNVKREADVAGEALKDTEIKDDFKKLVNEKAIFDEEKEISFFDTTIAYMFDKMAGDETIDNENFKKLREFKLRVCELTFLKGADGNNTLKVIFSANIKDYAEEINNKLGFAAKFISVPETVYLISESTFTIDENGVVVSSPKKISLGGIDNEQLGKTIIKVVVGDDEKMNDLNAKVGEAFSLFCKNLGKIGTLKDGNGQSGIVDHKLTFVTYVAEKNGEN